MACPVFVDDSTYPASDAEEENDEELYGKEEDEEEKKNIEVIDKKGEYRAALSALTACLYEDGFTDLPDVKHASEILNKLADIKKVCTYKIQRL